MSDKYVLKDGVPIPTDDLMAWGRFMSDGEARRVAVDAIGDVRVSTVFLGLNHQWGKGPPLLYETMVFGGEHDGHEERTSTRAEAEQAHLRACILVGR